MIKRSVIASIFLAWVCLCAAPARGDTLADIAQKAVLKNPEVLARWHNFRAASKEIDVARGLYLPSVDLSAGGGRERNQSVFDTTTLNRNNVTLTLSQMLYDGSAVRNEVGRLTNSQLTRYYELLDASENAALEAARAYHDVLRHRRLFALTEDNYVTHRTVFEQIQQKVQAGVGRRVDLEQAAGRLALSESNMVADNANVHDASARFQRIIGELPPAVLEDSTFLGDMVVQNAAAAHLSVAVDLHPAVLAAVENVRAARYDLDARKARYQPRVDFRLSQMRNSNVGGIAGKNSNAAAEVVMNWNLFSGGSDSARVEQYLERLDAARYQRDKVCRDIRMILAIAYNDVSKLQEQLNFLGQHRMSIEKARGAYQKQFEIGQRSLLDLLDTENELFQARRSYVNAEHDLATSHARTFAGMGRLVSSLGLTLLETAELPELLGANSDGPESCPPEAPLALNIRKAELDARAIAAAKPPEPPEPPAGADSTAPPATAPVVPDVSVKPLAPVQDARAAAEKVRLPQLPDDAPAEKIKESKGEAARVKAGKDAEGQAEKRAEAETPQAAQAEAERLKAEQEARVAAEEKARQAAQAEAEKRAEAETRKAAQAEAAHLKAEQEARVVAEEKARQAAQAEAEKRAEAETRQAAQAEAARLKAEQKARVAAEEKARRAAQAEAEKRVAAEARQAVQAEAERLKAEQDARAAAEEKARKTAQAEAEKRAEAEARQQAAQAEAAYLKAEQEAQSAEEKAIQAAQAEAEQQDEAETRQAAQAEAAYLKAEQEAQAAEEKAQQEDEAGMVKSEAKEEFGAEVSSTATGKGQADGVDWSGKQFWLVEMHEILERDAVAAAWRNLRTRFSNQMKNRTIIPRLQGGGSGAGKKQAPRYQLFIADFPEKQIAEEFCAMLRLEQHRCGILPSRSLAERNVLNATSAGARDGF